MEGRAGVAIGMIVVGLLVMVFAMVGFDPSVANEELPYTGPRVVNLQRLGLQLELVLAGMAFFIGGCALYPNGSSAASPAAPLNTPTLSVTPASEARTYGVQPEQPAAPSAPEGNGEIGLLVGATLFFVVIIAVIFFALVPGKSPSAPQTSGAATAAQLEQEADNLEAMADNMIMMTEEPAR